MHHDLSILFEQECEIQVMGMCLAIQTGTYPIGISTSNQRAFQMNHIDFFEAMRAAFDLEGIIKVVSTVFRANCLDEIDDNAVRPLLVLAFHRNNLFQQSILRQRGTRTNQEEAAKRRAVWQKEANKVWEDNPRWSNTDVGNQVRINLNRKKKGSCKPQGRYIGRIIKKPF